MNVRVYMLYNTEWEQARQDGKEYNGIKKMHFATGPMPPMDRRYVLVSKWVEDENAFKARMEALSAQRRYEMIKRDPTGCSVETKMVGGKVNIKAKEWTGWQIEDMYWLAR